MPQELPTYADVYERHHWMYAHNTPDEMKHIIEYEDGLDVGPGWLALLDRALTQIGKEVRRMPAEDAQKFALLQSKRSLANW